MLKALLGVVLISLSSLASGAVLASELDTANELVGEGKYQQAYDLLAPLEFDLSGDEAFDLLFGFTALETGNISISSLAFERVLALNPDSNTARFHLARAYFELSDYDGARREFELLLSLNPTAGIRETVGQYLDAIASRQPGAKTSYSTYLALGIGTDSNVTGATTDSTVFFPGLGQNFTLDENEQEDEDSYNNLSAGIDIIHKTSDANSVYAGGDIDYRGHGDREDLDYANANLRGGFQHSFGNQSVRFGLNAGYFDLDGEDYQQNHTLDIEWRNTIEQRTQIGVVGSFSAFRHEDEADEISDYDDSHLNFSWLKVVGEQGTDIISSSFTIGSEDDLNDRADGNLDYLRLTLSGQMAFGNGHNAFLLVSGREKRFDKENFLLLKKRSESQISLTGGVIFKLSKSLSIRPLVNWSSTSSNFDLYDNTRSDVSVTLRMDFI